MNLYYNKSTAMDISFLLRYFLLSITLIAFVYLLET